MEERELTEQGEAFIRGWYARIDAKVPFEEIAGDTAGESLIVDFPGNPLAFFFFLCWYRGSAGILRAGISSTPYGCPAATRKWRFFPKLHGQRKRQRGER